MGLSPTLRNKIASAIGGGAIAITTERMRRVANVTVEA